MENDEPQSVNLSQRPKLWAGFMNPNRNPGNQESAFGMLTKAEYNIWGHNENSEV